MSSLQFRFDRDIHAYFDLTTGDVFPHITGMLEAAGWIDDRWYTEESCERGQAVHDLTAEFDLGVLEVASCESPYRGYVLGHVEAMRIIRPTFSKVEEPIVHPVFRFGGRPDRAASRFYGLKAVVEIKTGQAEKAHQIQTALQAILEADDFHLPAERVARFALYLQPNGRFKLVEHPNRADFDEARRIIRRYAA